MFDPALQGLLGIDVAAAAKCSRPVQAKAAKIDGVKVSLLDAGHEIALAEVSRPP